MSTPILRCIWCCKDTETNPCQHCQSEHVYDRTQPHKPMWSRKTMRTVECKICDREIPAGEQGQPGDECRPTITNP